MGYRRTKQTSYHRNYPNNNIKHSESTLLLLKLQSQKEILDPA